MERARLSQVPLAPADGLNKGEAAPAAARARALASIDYRSDMLSRQQPAYLLRRASSSSSEPIDLRRLGSWAPFAILPGALLCVRRVPHRLRVPFYGGSLLVFAIFSAGMWDTREELG